MTTDPAPTGPPGTPARWPSLSPYLAVHDARAAIRYYTEAFGAEPVGSLFVADDGRVGHAEIRIGNGRVMLADPWDVPGVADPTTAGITTVQLHLEVDDVDETYRRAVAAGGTGLRPPRDEPYGDRAASVRDPFGHQWMLNTAGEPLTETELAERIAPGGFRLAGADEVDPGERAPAPPAEPG